MTKEDKKALLNQKTFAEFVRNSGMTYEEFAEEIGIMQNVQSTELYHDIKNCMQNISGLLSIIDLKCHKYNVIIQTIAPIRHELSEIIIRLNEQIKYNLHKEENIYLCSLNQLITETLQNKRAQFAASQITLETNLTEDLPPILLDKQRIKQVLTDCLNNSYAAILAKKQPRLISITTQLIQATDMIQIIIQDNGIGLTQEQQAIFFKPYYTTKPQGNGIGTSISLAIIRLHGGNMSVSGQPGQGCRICIELPIHGKPTFNNEDFYKELANILFES